MKKVYLAGPISGLKFGEASDWRTIAADAFYPEIEGFSPLRAKEFLHAKGELADIGYDESILACPRGIMTRDHWDCMTADVILANLLGAKKVSQGTVMELAWGFAYRKPVVAVMEKEGNVHEHAMVTEAINYRVETLDEAIAVCKAILLCKGR